MMRLFKTTLIRVGKEEYARQNRSYGLITLRNRHARMRGGEVVFRFRGKSGREHQIGLFDPRLARLVKRLRELPGHELFPYVAADGAVLSVDSAELNPCLRETGCEVFSAKDFSTRSGTVSAALFLAEQVANAASPTKTTLMREADDVHRLGGLDVHPREVLVLSTTQRPFSYSGGLSRSVSTAPSAVGLGHPFEIDRL